MAFVLKDAFVEIDGVDLSCHVASVEVMLSKAEVEANTMCGQATLAGIEQSAFTVSFLQSFAVGEVDDTLFPIFDDETAVTINVRPHQTAVATTNPQYSGSVKLFEYTPLAGAVNERSETSVTFPVQGSISRTTA
jgi:hypothetical protein